MFHFYNSENITKVEIFVETIKGKLKLKIGLKRVKKGNSKMFNPKMTTSASIFKKPFNISILNPKK